MSAIERARTMAGEALGMLDTRPLMAAAILTDAASLLTGDPHLTGTLKGDNSGIKAVPGFALGLDIAGVNRKRAERKRRLSAKQPRRHRDVGKSAR
jgi:hypothetical protein